MDEYISRNELLKVVQSNVAEAHNERCGQLLEAILNAPTADVVPQSEVAREIFEQFRSEMRAEIARNEQLFAEDEDDFYEGRNDAFRTAINCLNKITNKYDEIIAEEKRNDTGK